MSDSKNILYRIRGKLIRIVAPYLPDALYLKLLFRHRIGHKLNLKNPKTYNEKLQWLKLNDIHPEYTQMVDKIEAKKYVASIIGEEYIIPTLGVYESVDDIDFDKLPQQFVLKCTHDSGGIVVCKDKSKLDIERAKAKLKKGWGQNYFKYNREYPYRDVKPRIIAEIYMEDESGYELKDYKFFCFNGEPRFFKIDFDRQKNHKANYYDLDMNLQEFGEKDFPPNPSVIFLRPANFDKMISIARQLAGNIPFVRIDLYNVNGHIYFGEITFFPASGMGQFTSNEWDYRIGDLLQLPLT